MDGGDQVAAEFEVECDVPSTGGHYRDEEMHLWTFDEGGKVVRLRHYTDTAKHIRAAGLRSSYGDKIQQRDLFVLCLLAAGLVGSA